MEAGERPRGQRLELTTAHGIETVPVTFGTTGVQADFDLGNGTGLLISEELAQRLKLETVGVEPGGGIGGAKPRAVVFVPELTIAGHAFRHVRAHIDPGLRSDANIGLAQLAAFRIWTDFPGRAVYLEPRED